MSDHAAPDPRTTAADPSPPGACPSLSAGHAPLPESDVTRPRRGLARLGYEAAIRALEVQERAVDQLRARTGTLVAATSLTASFLGAQTIQYRHGLNTLAILALVTLGLAILTCVYIMLPKQGFVFSLNAIGIYEALYEHADDEEEVHRRLVYWLEGYWQQNQLKIDRLARLYALGAIALTIQLALWSAALATNI